MLQAGAEGGRGKERELISWDEVEDKKDVYEAVTTPDGRQALVRSAATGGRCFPGTQGGRPV